jgi:hypothetical protein
MCYGGLTVRPYQLMCIVCEIGAADDALPSAPRLREIVLAVKKDPLIPITLRCNVTGTYRYQNPGRAEDTPEGALYNDLRDLTVLQKLSLVPGDTRTAWDIFHRLFQSIKSPVGICALEGKDSANWPACARARSGAYEKAHARGVGVVIPVRSEEEMARVKSESASKTEKAQRLRIRPHHLMCLACFHGGKPFNQLAPIKADNLYEVIAAIHRNPDIPVSLVEGCCDVCPPCRDYHPPTGLCVGATGMGLRDQKKDLDVLRRLDLRYGDTIPARKLFRMLFDEIKSTTEICGNGDGIERSPDWRVCGGPQGNESYRKARAANLGIPASD